MVNSEKMLKHMAWANSEILSKVALLPDEALDAYVVNPEWTARVIIQHLVRSAHFYGYRLQIRTPEETQGYQSKFKEYVDNQSLLTKSTDVLALVELLKYADNVLLKESKADEGIVLREEEDTKINPSRSTVIFQSIHHATEHRAQVVSALEARGFLNINLDDYDFWGYAQNFGEF